MEAVHRNSAADWLASWDAGSVVKSVSMGGLGPGYEQCIQVTAAEILRVMLARQFDSTKWSDADTWKKDRDAIDAEVMALPAIKAIGFSDEQWGAAMNLASCLYMRGQAAFADEVVKDRLILVSRAWPGAEAP